MQSGAGDAPGPVSTRRLRGWLAPTRTGILAALLAGLAIFHFATMRAGVRWNGDDVMYMLHARNLVAGLPYDSTGYIQHPYFYLAPRAYPPGFPLLLAPVVAAFGLDPLPMKVLVTLCLLGGLALLARILRDELPFPWLCALIAVIGLHPYLWDYRHAIMADLPFVVFAYLALLLYTVAGSAPRGGARALAMAAAAGVISYYAILTRAFGVVLLPAFLTHDLARHRRPTRVLMVVAVAFVAAHGLRTAVGRMAPDHPRDTVTAGQVAGAEPPASGYGKLLRREMAKLGRNLRHAPATGTAYARALAGLWDNGVSRTVTKALFVLSLALAGIGFLGRLRGGGSPVEHFAVWYAAALLPWSFMWNRYLIPVIPLYFFYVVRGLLRVLPRGRARLPVTVAAAAIVALTWAGRYAALGFGPIESDLTTPEARDFYAYVRQHTAADDILIVDGWWVRQVMFFTGRSASLYFPFGDDDRSLGHLRGIGADLFVLGRPDRAGGPDYMREIVTRHPDVFRPVFANTRFQLFRIVAPPGNVPAGSPGPGPTAALDAAGPAALRARVRVRGEP